MVAAHAAGCMQQGKHSCMQERKRNQKIGVQDLQTLTVLTVLSTGCTC